MPYVAAYREKVWNETMFPNGSHLDLAELAEHDVDIMDARRLCKELADTFRRMKTRCESRDIPAAVSWTEAWRDGDRKVGEDLPGMIDALTDWSGAEYPKLED